MILRRLRCLVHADRPSPAVLGPSKRSPIFSEVFFFTVKPRSTAVGHVHADDRFNGEESAPLRFSPFKKKKRVINFFDILSVRPRDIATEERRLQAWCIDLGRRLWHDLRMRVHSGLKKSLPALDNRSP